MNKTTRTASAVVLESGKILGPHLVARSQDRTGVSTVQVKTGNGKLGGTKPPAPLMAP